MWQVRMSLFFEDHTETVMVIVIEEPEKHAFNLCGYIQSSTAATVFAIHSLLQHLPIA